MDGPMNIKKKTRISYKVFEQKMCVFMFSTSFVWNIFHSKKNSAT